MKKNPETRETVNKIPMSRVDWVTNHQLSRGLD